MFEFVVIVESEADARIATKLAERVIVEQVDWLELEHIEYMFRWCGLDEEDKFSCWKNLNDIIQRAKESGIRLPRYRGKHKYGEPPIHTDGANATKILNLVRALQKNRNIRTVLFIRDLDNEPTRRQGIEWARSEQVGRLPELTIVVGTPDRMREAWVLNGFIPDNQDEEKLLKEIIDQLNFDPCLEAHRLRSRTNDESNRTRNPKVVLDKLTGNDHEREQRCWEKTDLRILRDRGDNTGLKEYLMEVKEQLVPVVRDE